MRKLILIIRSLYAEYEIDCKATSRISGYLIFHLNFGILLLDMGVGLFQRISTIIVIDPTRFPCS